MEHQIHFGKKFYQDKKTKYWISCCYPRVRAHRWVWENHYGSILKGFHVHHKDENKSNNDIRNLSLLKASDHLSLHMQTQERKRFSKDLCDKIRPLTKEWHGSDEGLKWHKKHGIDTWNNRISFSVKCSECSKSFDTKVFHHGFCSNSCKSRSRRKSGIDNEERICHICQNQFTVNKYAKSICCSKKCGGVFRHQKH